MKVVKEKKIIFIAAAAVLVLVILLGIIIGGCASNSPKGALESMFNKAKNLDIKGVAALNYELQFDKDATKESINAQIDSAQKSINENKEMAEMAKNMYKGAKMNVTKDEKLVQTKVDELKEEWSSYYKDTDKIKEIHELTYSISGFGSSSEDTCYAVKVGGKWYIKGLGGLSSIAGI